MDFRVFFSILAIGRTVSSQEPETCAEAETVFDLFAALKEEGDFFGLIDASNTCLQVMYEPIEDRYWFEVPRPDIGGSYGKHFSFDEAQATLKELPKLFPVEGLSGFKFRAW